jgi:hypothetical protein
VTLATYAIAAQLGAQGRRRLPWLCTGVALNIAALAALRYGYRAAPFEAPFAVLGISFYSLQALAYLFDTYSGTLRTPHTLADFALYLAYFPKIVAGPIERPQAFFRQLAQPRIVDDERFARAGTLIAVGLISSAARSTSSAARRTSSLSAGVRSHRRRSKPLPNRCPVSFRGVSWPSASRMSAPGRTV